VVEREPEVGGVADSRRMTCGNPVGTSAATVSKAKVVFMQSEWLYPSELRNHPENAPAMCRSESVLGTITELASEMNQGKEAERGFEYWVLD
jgi:hypothetical protein